MRFPRQASLVVVSFAALAVLAACVGGCAASADDDLGGRGPTAQDVGAGATNDPVGLTPGGSPSPTGGDAMQIGAAGGAALEPADPAPGDDGLVDPSGDGVPVSSSVDPGAGPWVPVAPEEVASVCQLDPAGLAAADAALNVPWAIIRHGRLCHAFKTEGVAPEEAWSTTKTLGALVAGAVAYQTRDIARTGPKTGAFSDEDLAADWLDAVTYNPQARVAHVLAMVAHNTDLSFGNKPMQYDTIGTVQINSLSDMLNAAIRQDPTRLGADLEQFTQRFVFGPLGMKESSWSAGAPTKTFAFSWSTTALDMARLGLLMLHGGMWNGERIVDADWIYRMTHPAFEDGNTGYGYLTWVNAASNHHFGGIPLALGGMQQVPLSPGACAPVSLHKRYPHGMSESPDCGYAAPYTCAQEFDVGVWQAVGLGGQVIQGHPGLDMVIVVKNLTPVESGPSAPGKLWDAVRRAVIDGDPNFSGDETGFCTEYGANRYAPDLH